MSIYTKSYDYYFVKIIIKIKYNTNKSAKTAIELKRTYPVASELLHILSADE